MGILNGEVAKPSLLEKVTLRGLVSTFGIAFGATSLGFVALFILGFAFFTAKESDVPWYYPVELLNTGLWMLSGVGLGASLLAACIQHFQRD